MNQSQDKTSLFLPLLKYWVPIVSIVAIILNTSMLLILVDLVMIIINSVSLKLNLGITTPTPVETAEIVRWSGNVVLIISVIVSFIKYIRKNTNAKN